MKSILKFIAMIIVLLSLNSKSISQGNGPLQNFYETPGYYIDTYKPVPMDSSYPPGGQILF
ncbi:MAG: hypothetical protein WAT71_03445 [Ignavibacteria bacterium]